MRAALKELRVGGIKTNVDLLDRVLACDDFVAGQYATDLIARSLSPLEAPPISDERAFEVAAMAAVHHARQLAERQPATPDGSRWATVARETSVRRSEAWSR